MKEDSLIHIFQLVFMLRFESFKSQITNPGRNYKDQEPYRKMVQHLFSRDKRRLQESGFCEWSYDIKR